MLIPGRETVTDASGYQNMPVVAFRGTAKILPQPVTFGIYHSLNDSMSKEPLGDTVPKPKALKA